MASCVATMEKPGYFSRCSVSFVTAMENAFYRYGRTVGSHPCVCIIASILLVIVCSSGLANFRRETRTEKLWAPTGSQSLKDLSRVQYYFPPKYRREVLLIEADNVLDPKVLQTMLIIDQRIKNITVRGQPWQSMCYQQSSQCYSSSLLELWSYNAQSISKLTQADIVNKINKRRLISPVFDSKFDLDATLGMVTRNGLRVIGAKATTMTYYITDRKAAGIEDRIAAAMNSANNLDGIEEEWEDAYLDIAKLDYTNITVYRYADKSFRSEASTAIRGDMGYLSGAYIILVIYVSLATSNFSMIEHKVYIAISCILTVGFATLTAIGLASASNLAFDNLHSVLPFLLLGIGIDDMFVIIASWNNLTHEQKQFQVREQAGLTLRHAGVSIAVTSITDLCAFFIGASTILPSLKSFCIYSAIGVMCLFLFSTTFFMACLTIDRRRYESRRDACCCCYKYRETYKPSEWGQRSVLNEMVKESYAPFLLRLPVKVIVLAISLVLLSVCAWGTVTWKQDFDLRRFLLSDSYYKSYLDKSQKYFPSKGIETAVYLENVDFYKERDTLNNLYAEVKEDPYIQDRTIQCWYQDFQEWIETKRNNHVNLDNSNWPTKRSFFDQFLEEFLVHKGQQYTADIALKNESTILASRYIRATHDNLWNTNVEITAMNSLKLIVSKTQLKNPNAAFVYSESYLFYEVNTILRQELLRNLSLAATCIFLVVTVLLASIWASVLVFLCVIITLIDIAGTLNLMGVTIDTVVSVPVILAIGIAIDYSVHICHAFLVLAGSRNARVKRALVDKGVAVFKGGMSSLLAFILLAFSRSYVFTTFFKIFLLIVLYGLFHGLAVLPVLLSFIGPVPYPTAQPADPVDYNKIIIRQNLRRRFFRERRCYSI